MRTLTTSLLLAAGATLSYAAAFNPHFDLKSFTALVIFGDSFTDQGVHSYTPFPNGTLPDTSNETSTGGRVWPQYIEQYTGINIYDYAVGGAVCDNIISPEDRNGIKQDQLPAFLSDNAWVNETSGRPALDNPADETVYAVWIGTNDIGNGAFMTEWQPRGLPITSYTDCVFEQLDRLYQAGGRNFVVMNLAPLDLLAQYALPKNGGVDAPVYWEDKLEYNANITQISEKMRQNVDMLNEIYHFQVPYQVKLARRYPHSAFAIFDTHSLMTDMWHNPTEYFNGTAPLNVTGYVTACKDTTCSERSDWDSFMWYDELHPSEQTDRIVAKEFLKVVKGSSKYAEYWRS